MLKTQDLPALSLVEAVDRVTRAVHIGARLPGARGRPLDSVDRSYLGGFIAALVEALNLDGGFAELVVYAYLLQEGMEADAARFSRVLLGQPHSPELARAFERGQSDAGVYLRTGRTGL
ncbi:MAG: hypothetical protein JNK40_01280 [Chromatiales bacterium]|nr:hypothetical protein [Chromatiales bacterium]